MLYEALRNFVSIAMRFTNTTIKNIKFETILKIICNSYILQRYAYNIFVKAFYGKD